MSTIKRADLIKYHTQGYIGPFDAFGPDEIKQHRDFLDEKIIKNLANEKGYFSNVHVFSKTVFQVITQEAILGGVKQIVGDDVLLWKASFVPKRPNEVSDTVRWHQDSHFREMHPYNAVVVWLALDDITLENGCLEVLPGTHWHDVPHIESSNSFFQAEADTRFFKTSPTEKLICRAGQFFIFNERIIHKSDINRSDKKRIAMVGRFAGTNVFIQSPKSACILVSGEDKFKYNTLTKVPTEL